MAELNFNDLLFEFNLGFRSIKAKIKHLQERDSSTAEGLEELKRATIYLQKYVGEAMNQLVNKIPESWGEKLPVMQIHIFADNLKEEGVSDPDDTPGLMGWSPPYNEADIL